MNDNDKIKIIATNRKANFQYSIFQRFEAGISLTGTEVKSLRSSKVNFQDSYVKYIKDGLWLINLHISEYKHGTALNHEPLRKRRLLLHKREIKRIKSQLEEKGLTMIPMKIYLKGSLIKIELGLAKGKKLFDKRETIIKRETERKLKKL
ncbi:MAG: SsrA-binding protein SmpB [Ignavibacteria bacterium]|nr:SsrA-binding protein SmpB [Ignavibacteria bacterium]